MEIEDINKILMVISIVLLLTTGFFGYKYYSIDKEDSDKNKELNDAFSLGYNKSLIDVSQGQMQTGTILLWINDSIQIVSIQTLCIAGAGL
jgi:hypothetical protein